MVSEVCSSNSAGACPLSEIELLTAREVAELLKCSRSQIYALRRRGVLPAPLQLFPGERGTRWLKQDIVEFILAVRGRLNETQHSAPRPFVPLKLAAAGTQRTT
jgi:excisionase family DNA binding protein